MRTVRRLTIDWIAIALAIVSVIVWASKLEGRVDAQDRSLTSLQSQYEQNTAQLREDVAYMRARIDQALDGGGLPR